MPNKLQHISHVKHNISFLENFYSKYEFNDWAITVAFYIAVHIVEAAIATKKKKVYKDKEYQFRDSGQFRKILSGQRGGPENLPEVSVHEIRQVIIDHNFKEISGDYYLLYNHSVTARYIQYSWIDAKVNLMIGALKKIMKWSNREHRTSFNVSSGK